MNHMTRNIVRLERQPPQNPKSTWGGLLAGVFFILSPDGGEDVGRAQCGGFVIPADSQGLITIARVINKKRLSSFAQPLQFF
jgi:hypothetical protein